MKKSILLKPIVALLLSLIMIIGAVLPAAAQTAVGISQLDVGGSTDTPDGAEGEESYPDWFKLINTENSITIVISPELGAILGSSAEQLQRLFDSVGGVLEDIIITQLRDSFVPEEGDALADGIWRNIVHDYVSEHFAGGGEVEAEHYLEFFRDILKDDSTHASGLIDFTCETIEQAVAMGVDIEKLPTPDALRTKIKDVLDEYIKEEIALIAEEAIENYVRGEAPDSDVEFFAQKFVHDLFDTVLLHYTDGIIGDDIDEFGANYVNDLLFGVVDRYIAGTLANSGADKYAKDLIDTHFKKVVDEYLDGSSSSDALVNSYVDKFIDDIVSDTVDKYLDFKVNGTSPTHSNDLERYAYESVEDYISDYITSVKENYVDYKDNGVAFEYGDKTLNIIENFASDLKSKVPVFVNKYLAYMKGESDIIDDYNEYSQIYTFIATEAYKHAFARLNAEYEAGNDIVKETINTNYYGGDGSLSVDDYNALRGDKFGELIDRGYVNVGEIGDAADTVKFETLLPSVSDESIIRELAKDENKSVIDDYIEGNKADIKSFVIDEIKALPEADRDEQIDDVIMTVLEKLDANEADLSALFKSLVKDITADPAKEDELVSMALGELYADTENYEIFIDKIKHDSHIEELLGAALHDLFDLGLTPEEGETNGDAALRDLDEHVAVITEQLLVKYELTVDELREGAKPEIDPADLLDYLKGVEIWSNTAAEPTGGIIMDENGTLSIEVLSALISDLPSAEKVANMDAADMRISYKVRINADVFGQLLSASFDITAAIDTAAEYEDEHDKIRFAAQFLHDTFYFDYNEETGATVFGITLPDMVSVAIKRLCRSDSVSPELKERLYSVLVGDIVGIKDFIDNLTFDELLLMVEELDWEGFVAELDELAKSNTDFRDVYSLLKARVDFTKYKNDEIIDALRPFRAKYDSIKKLIDKAVAKIYPQIAGGVEDGEDFLAALYKGVDEDDYAVFELNHEYKFSLFNLIDGLDARLSSMLEEYPEILSKITFILGKFKDGLGETDLINGPLKLYVRAINVAEVKYYVAGELHRTGYLVKGVNPQSFAGVSLYQASDGSYYEIDGWVTESGEKITYMPLEDITLHALVNLDETVKVNAPSISFTYDTSTRKIAANLLSYDERMFGQSPAITYQWYKDGSLLVGETGPELQVTEIGDGGRYSCTVTLECGVNSASATANATVSVAPPIPSVQLRDDSGNYYYDNSYVMVDVGEQVTLSASAESVLIRDITYQWYRRHNGQSYAISGATSNSLTLTDSSDAGAYYCRIGYRASNVETRFYVNTSSPTYKVNKIYLAPTDIWDYSYFADDAPFGLNVIVGTDKVLGDDYKVYDSSYTEGGYSFNELFDVTLTEDGKRYSVTLSIKDTAHFTFLGGYDTARLEWYKVQRLTDGIVDVTVNGESLGNPSSGIVIDELYSAEGRYVPMISAGDGFESTSVSWKKNGTAYLSSPVFGAVTDSGVYEWTLTTNDFGYTQSVSGRITVKIGVDVKLSLNGSIVDDAVGGVNIDETFSPYKEYAFALSLAGMTADTRVVWTKDGEVFTGTPTFKNVSDSGVYTWTVTTPLYEGCVQVVSGTVDISIAKGIISIDGTPWVGETEHTYSPENHNATYAAPTLSLGVLAEYLDVTYTVNGKSDLAISRPDRYIVRAEVTLKDNVNCELVGANSLECEVVVNKYLIPAQALLWEYDITDGGSLYESGRLSDKSTFIYKDGRVVSFSLSISGLSDYIEPLYTSDSKLDTSGIVLAPQQRAEGTITVSGFRLRGSNESFSDYYTIDTSYSNTVSWTLINTREIYLGHIFDGDVTVYDRGDDEVLRDVTMTTVFTALGNHTVIEGYERLYLISKYELSLRYGGEAFNRSSSYDVRIYIDDLDDYIGSDYGRFIVISGEGDSRSVITEVRYSVEGDREYIEFSTDSVASTYTVAVENPDRLPNEEYYDEENDVYIKDNTDGYILDGYNLLITKWTGATKITLPNGKHMDILDAYNIRFVNSLGETPEYDENFSFTVRLRLPKGVDTTKLHIIYIDATNIQDGAHASYEYEISDDGEYISFTANHFSVYSIATETEVGPIVGPSAPAMPSGMGVLLIVLVSMALIAFGVLMFRLFSGRTTKKELIILLVVLIFVVIVGAIALYANLTKKDGDSGEPVAYSYETDYPTNTLAYLGEGEAEWDADIEENTFFGEEF